MKATLEFNLPQDHNAHMRAVNALNAWEALVDTDAKLRNLIKYGVDKGSSYEQELTHIRKRIADTMTLLGE